MSRVAEYYLSNDYINSFCEEKKVKKTKVSRREPQLSLQREEPIASNYPMTFKRYAEFLKRNYPKLDVGRQKIFNYFREEGVLRPDSRKPKDQFIKDGLFTYYVRDTTSYQRYEIVPMITPDGQRVYTLAIVRMFTKQAKAG